MNGLTWGANCFSIINPFLLIISFCDQWGFITIKRLVNFTINMKHTFAATESTPKEGGEALCANFKERCNSFDIAFCSTFLVSSK